jgi:large subunit ribosomal protein LP2
MKYLAAYLLLVAGGNTQPSAEDLKAILSSVGAEVEESRVAALIKAMEGKTVAEVRLAPSIQLVINSTFILGYC